MEPQNQYQHLAWLMILTGVSKPPLGHHCYVAEAPILASKFSSISSIALMLRGASKIVMFFLAPITDELASL